MLLLFNQRSTTPVLHGDNTSLAQTSFSLVSALFLYNLPSAGPSQPFLGCLILPNIPNCNILNCCLILWSQHCAAVVAAAAAEVVSQMLISIKKLFKVEMLIEKSNITKQNPKAFQTTLVAL